MAKQPQLQQLVQQVEDIMGLLLVNMGHLYLSSRNGQLVEPAGNGYQYNQAVDEVQLRQSDSVEAAKDHQQSSHVKRLQNPVFDESVTSALLA